MKIRSESRNGLVVFATADPCPRRIFGGIFILNLWQDLAERSAEKLVYSFFKQAEERNKVERYLRTFAKQKSEVKILDRSPTKEKRPHRDRLSLVAGRGFEPLTSWL